jgi:hypothetical protein
MLSMENKMGIKAAKKYCLDAIDTLSKDLNESDKFTIGINEIPAMKITTCTILIKSIPHLLVNAVSLLDG